ncbi:MAG: hypothetical protein WC503_03315 [Candidatus Shapirobacteria bacterium]
MVEIIKCPNCNGRGCSTCKFKGTLIRDESGKLFVNDIEDNSGIRNEKDGHNSGLGFFNWIFNEPHDLFWAIKKNKR